VVDHPYKKYVKLGCPGLTRYNTGVQPTPSSVGSYIAVASGSSSLDRVEKTDVKYTVHNTCVETSKECPTTHVNNQC